MLSQFNVTNLKTNYTNSPYYRQHCRFSPTCFNWVSTLCGFPVSDSLAASRDLSLTGWSPALAQVLTYPLSPNPLTLPSCFYEYVILYNKNNFNFDFLYYLQPMALSIDIINIIQNLNKIKMITLQTSIPRSIFIPDVDRKSVLHKARIPIYIMNIFIYIYIKENIS